MARGKSKTWSPRFRKNTHPAAAGYSESVSFDQRLALCDVTGSKAHAKMLRTRRIISLREYKEISTGLDSIRKEIEAGKFDWRMEDEDVHMNIERRLIEITGEVGKKLHTARSRNDQVAVDIRLWLRSEIEQIVRLLDAFRLAALDLAEKHTDTLMPGFTHLQTAQPVVFAHHLLAYDQMFGRDQQRLADCAKRMNRSPLGACALAGTSFDIDPAETARELGFDGPCANSIDAVSDRDHLIEFCSAASICMMHFSRLSEELVLWSSQAFEFVRIGDGFTTGSSIMPQKRNPDIPEIARGKTGRVYGDLMALLTLMKSQPLAYNRDNQEDKERVFDSVDTLKSTIETFAAMIPTITANPEAMLRFLAKGFANATELADYLVRQGIPFREAHGIVAAVVSNAERAGRTIESLEKADLIKFSPHFGEVPPGTLNMRQAVQTRRHTGGTSPANCRAAIKRSRNRIAAAKKRKPAIGL